MENIRVDAKKHTFTMDLSYSTEDVVYDKAPVSGTVTHEVVDWLTTIKPIKVQVKADNEKGYEWVKTGREATTFQRFLSKIGFDVKTPDVLHDMVFESDNRSPEYTDNPFRLFLGKQRATLTMVNLPAKRKVSILNEETGEVTNRFSNKTYRYSDGTTVKCWIPKSEFRRLIVETEKAYEEYVAPTQD